MGTISLFSTLTFKLVIAWKQWRSILTCRICSSSASQNKIVSSANKRCETHTPPLRLPSTLKPQNKPASSALLIILLKTSIITRNLESTDAAGRVPHPSPMRDAASDMVDCASVPCLSFFFFFSRIRTDTARFAPNRLRFTLNWADSAKIGPYRPY